MSRQRAAASPRLPLPGLGEPGIPRWAPYPAHDSVPSSKPAAIIPRRYLALALPHLPVERLRHSGPVLVWRTAGPRREVTALSGVQGVRPGQALSDAQAVAPEALAVEADPAADAALLERLALWTMRFSPLVAMDDGALILDVTGATHLFGGEASVLRRAVEALSRLGLTACGVVAGAPGTALALARAGIAGHVVPPGREAEAVSGLGLSVLPVDPDVVTALARIGLRRIGQVRQQPRAPLARRFGAALLRALDEAAGEVSAPISPIRPPLDFDVAREFLEPLISRDAIDIALDGLLQRLCRKLEAAGRGVRRVMLRAHRVDGGVQEIGIGLHLASRDPAHMARLFAQRLEGLEPGFGFDRIQLGAEVTEEMAGVQAGFMGGALQQEELAQLLDRLAQRVEVWRLAPAASHWPEREVARVPATSVVQAPPGWPRAPRPLLLLRRPLEVGAMALLPDAPPSLLRIGRIGHRVRQAEGPERLDAEWWRDPPDRPGRDYYRLELASGVRLWVCRSGFGEAARWFIHGRL